MEYNYPHFKRQLLMEDMDFGSGPKPGERLPDFDLATTEGAEIRLSDFLGRKPLLITSGSVTCPMTASADPILKELHQEFGDRIEFITLYVREAHPGENYPQPRSFEEKLEHARLLKRRDQLPWTVAVDDANGAFHRMLDEKPNSAYLINKDGIVVFRSLWANTKRPIQRALDSLVSGKEIKNPESKSKLVPMLSGMGKMKEMLDTSGKQARKDVLTQAPPMYMMASMANGFKPLPPLGRGIASMALAGAFMGASVAGLAGLGTYLKRRSAA